MDIRATIQQIRVEAEKALEALADEREGAFTNAVNEIHKLSAELHDVVSNW